VAWRARPRGPEGYVNSDVTADVEVVLTADTANNIRETGEFCTSIISDTWIEAANYTSIDAPANVDEWKLSGLTPRASE